MVIDEFMWAINMCMVTDKDLANGWVDEYGVTYSQDGKRLLRGAPDLISYMVPEGTEAICDEAFFFYECQSQNEGELVDSEFCKNPNFIEVVFPSSLRIIGRNAFSACSGLTAVRIPKGVNRIFGFAFMMCKNLEEVTLPSTLAHLGAMAFERCNLSHIVLPRGLDEISRALLANNPNLREVVLPAKATNISNNIFDGCEKLEKLIVRDASQLEHYRKKLPPELAKLLVVE